MSITGISEAVTTYFFATGEPDECDTRVGEVGREALAQKPNPKEPQDIRSRPLLATAQVGAGLPWLNDLPFELKCLGVPDSAVPPIRHLIDRAENPAKYVSQGVEEPLALLLEQEPNDVLASLVRLGIKKEDGVVNQFESLVRLIAREAGVPFFALDSTPVSSGKDAACLIFVNEPSLSDLAKMNEVLKQNPLALFVIATNQIGLFAEGYPFILARVPEKMTVVAPPPLSAAEAGKIFTALEKEKNWKFSSGELREKIADVCEQLAFNYLQIKALIQRAMCSAIFSGRTGI